MRFSVAYLIMTIGCLLNGLVNFDRIGEFWIAAALFCIAYELSVKNAGDKKEK